MFLPMPNALLIGELPVRMVAIAMPSPVARMTTEAGATASPITMAVSVQAMSWLVERMRILTLTTKPTATSEIRVAQVVVAVMAP
ncbi:hypothetical protein GCM10029963_47330 [Micromonospora andamanensis]